LCWKKPLYQDSKTTLESPTSDQRSAYRYRADCSDCLEVSFLDKKIPLFDISAGGISFYNQGFSVNDMDVVTFDLNLPFMKKVPVFSCALKIISIDENNLCHLEFVDISGTEQEIIHLYVLKQQEKQLKKIKRNKLNKRRNNV